MDGDLAVIARPERRSDRRWWIWAGRTGRIVYRATTTTRERRDAREGCDERPRGTVQRLSAPKKEGRKRDERLVALGRAGRRSERSGACHAVRPETDARRATTARRVAEADRSRGSESRKPPTNPGQPWALLDSPRARRA
jgi:hypothetical protein